VIATAPVLIATVDDSGPIQTAQIPINDTPEIIDNVPVMQFYGFSSVAPEQTDATAPFITGQRANPIIVATNNQQARLQNQQPARLISDRGPQVAGPAGKKAMASISIFAFSNRPATCMAVLVGGFFGKNSPRMRENTA
jgi:hypothetical protein